MSVTPAKSFLFSPVYFIPGFFSLSVTQESAKTNIMMKLFTNAVNTRTNPFTVSLLQQNLPSVLHSTCYNDEGFSFDEEVKHTEIGHLFEHILLEYLCKYKLLKGCDEAAYSGNTNWNWVKESFGTFHIEISAGVEDMDILNKAIEDSIKLVKKIMSRDNIKLHFNQTL